MARHKSQSAALQMLLICVVLYTVMTSVYTYFLYSPEVQQSTESKLQFFGVRSENLLMGEKITLKDGTTRELELYPPDASVLCFGTIACGVLTWRYTSRRKASSNRNIGVAVAFFVTVSFLMHSIILSRAWGPGDYSGPESPSFGDWIVYVFNHLLRASDLLDFLEAYGITITAFKPASHAARALVATFYAIISILLTGAILASQRNSVRSNTTTEKGKSRLKNAQRLKWLGRVILIMGLVLYVVTGLVRAWNAEEWGLWPVEQILRTLDIADVMTQWDLHLVPRDVTFLSGTAAMCFRFGVGIWVVQRLARTFGLAPEPALPHLPGEFDDLSQLPNWLADFEVVCKSATGGSSPERRIDAIRLLRIFAEDQLINPQQSSPGGPTDPFRHIVERVSRTFCRITLNDPTARVRLAAAKAWPGWMAESSRPEVLRRLTSESDPQVRSHLALAGIPEVAEPDPEPLMSKHETSTQVPDDDLDLDGDDEDNLIVLLDSLDDDADTENLVGLKLRREILADVPKSGRANYVKELADALTVALASSDSAVRIAAIKIVGWTNAVITQQIIVHASSDGSTSVVAEIIRSLLESRTVVKSLTPVARAAIPELLARSDWFELPLLPNLYRAAGIQPDSNEEKFRLAFLKEEYAAIARAEKPGVMFLLTHHQHITCQTTLRALATLRNRQAIPVLLWMWQQLSEKRDPFADDVERVVQKLSEWIHSSPCPLTQDQLRQIIALPDLTKINQKHLDSVAKLRLRAQSLLAECE